MAEFSDSLLHFDNVDLDVNENPSNAENQLLANIDEMQKLVPSNEITTKCDLTSSETLQSLETPNNHVEKPESTNEIFTDILDSLLQNVVNQQSNSTFSETSHTSTSITDCFLKNTNEIKISENSNELLINNLDAVPLDIKEHNKRSSDSGIHDSQNNIVEDMNMINFAGTDFNMSDDFQGAIIEFSNEENDVQFKDEEFHDAVQFFKDPSSFTFLENAGSTNAPAEPLMTRSSLYVNFDPLHAKFYSQSLAPNDLQGIAEDDIEPDAVKDATQSDIVPAIVNKHLTNVSPRKSLGNVLVSFDSPVINKEANSHSVEDKPSEPQGIAEDNIEPDTVKDATQSDIVPGIVNKHLTNVSPRKSLGNVLISFDSPVINKEANSHFVEDKPSEPQKLYTEEELQQALKIQELSMQETFLKRQHDLELSRSQKQQELETRMQAQNHLCKAFSSLLKEVTDIITALSEKEKVLQEKLETAEKENKKLKEDLKTSVEDLQSVESTFSDFHKRYEQCKGMLKTYTQNEDNLKQNLENLQVQLQEKEEMYKALQSRTEEMLDKANMEVANVKKAGDAQVAVLKAQLKKAELKISSLESDVKHVKIENGKLSSICDELMAKVSEG